jgi:hypothetical protein
MEATPDKHGKLVRPSFHDGCLLGIELMPSKSLRLLCRTVEVIHENDWRFLKMLTSTECKLLALFSGKLDVTAV